LSMFGLSYVIRSTSSRALQVGRSPCLGLYS
jgi:hypothetical protein